MALIYPDLAELVLSGNAPVSVLGGEVPQPYTEFVKDMAPYVTNCPSPVMVDALRHASVEFFRRSLAYRVWLEPFDLTTDQNEYVLTGFPTDTHLAHVLSVSCDGTDLEAVTHDELNSYDNKYPTLTGTRPAYYAIIKEPRLLVSPVPTETVASAFHVFVAVEPTVDSAGLEEVFMDEYRDYLIGGALARVMMIPGRHWSDPSAASVYRSKFTLGIEYARSKVNKGKTTRDMRVRMRSWV